MTLFRTFSTPALLAATLTLACGGRQSRDRRRPRAKARRPGRHLRHCQGQGRQRPVSLYRGGRSLHVRHDPPPCPGPRDGRLGAHARGERLAPDPGRADHQRPAGRDRDHAALAPATAASRCRKRARTGMKMNNGWACEHEMLMPGMLTEEQMRQLDQARGAGVRPAVPDLHDPAPPGRRHHGEGALRTIRRRPGRDGVQVRLRRQRRSVHRDRPDGDDARRLRLGATAGETALAVHP